MQSTSSPTLRVAVLATLIAASAACAAQTPVQPQPPLGAMPPPSAAPADAPPPVAGTPMPPARPPLAAPPLAGATPDATAQGTVARFITNPDGDVDGFMTDDGKLVRFPPHMSAQLTQAVRKGDRVQVSGIRDETGGFTALRITDERSGRQVIDEPPLRSAAPMPPAAHGQLAHLSAQGEVAHVTTAPRGEPDGVILADGTVIKLTPPVAQQFATLVRTGATVSAQGYGTRNQYGTALQATAFGSPGNLTAIYGRDARMP